MSTRSNVLLTNVTVTGKNTPNTRDDRIAELERVLLTDPNLLARRLAAAEYMQLTAGSNDYGL